MASEKYTAYLENGPDPAEQFISLESVEQMVLSGISDRIDADGIVSPERVGKYIQFDARTGTKWLIGPDKETYYRPGYLLPDENSFMSSDENGSTWRHRTHKWSVGGLLYQGLTGDEIINLDDLDLVNLEADSLALNQTLDVKSYNYYINNEQLYRSYHISNPTGGTQREFQPLRVYIPTGIDGMLVTRQVLEAGAELYGAKVWIPHDRPGQAKFRKDTPILEVETYAQLTSTVRALQTIKASGLLPEASFKPMAGHTVESLPGVYFAQRASGQSYNGMIRELFGPAIEAACLENNLQTGDSIYQTNWLAKVAMQVRELARSNAATKGIDPNNHAFVLGQPVQKLLDIINQA